MQWERIGWFYTIQLKMQQLHQFLNQLHKTEISARYSIAKKGKRRRSRRQQKSTRQIKMTKQSVYISHCLFGISNSTYGCVYEIWMCTVMDSFICILRLLTSWCCCCCCCYFSTLVNFFLHFYTLFYGVLIVFLRFVYNRCYRLTHTRTQSDWAYRFILFFFC